MGDILEDKFFIKIIRRNTLFGYTFLIALWWAAYKSADIFGIFETYASLWFLPAGVTIATVLAAPKKFILAPLVANLLLAFPQICWLLDIEWTNYRDPILHSFRLYIIYGGCGLVLRQIVGMRLPIKQLNDNHWILGLTILFAGLGALSGVSLHAVVGNFPWEVAWQILQSWAVGDAIGAIIVPPILVPFLIFVFGHSDGSPLDPFQYSIGQTIGQLAIIIAAMALAFYGPNFVSQLSGFWYLIILPVVFFALRGGFSQASTSIAFTALLAPPFAYLAGFSGEKLDLQLMLLITSLIGLTVGAAITERRNAFELLKQHEKELEQKVSQRTQQLEEAYGFQNHLIRSIGHDLRQPLQTLKILLDGVSMEMTEKPKAIGDARLMAQSASGLVNKVLEFARREAGNQSADLRTIELQPSFETLRILFEPSADAKGIHLKFPQTDLRILSDAELLEEALSNLLDNAIRLSNSNSEVQIAVEAFKDQILISVIDQVSGSTTNMQEGNGFGLEIVRQICSLLNGTLEIESNRFTIVLPNNL